MGKTMKRSCETRDGSRCQHCVAGAESFLGTMPEVVLNEIAENGRTTLVPRSGHYPPEDNPEAFAEAVIAFCERE
jgi:pimeloyl-ACP methyl ester carboxylesterase